MDEAGFYLLPMAVGTWSLIGQITVLRVPLTRDHLSAISGVTPDGRLFLQVRQAAYDAQAVVTFLRVLLRIYTEWTQIPVPRKTTHAPHNSGLHLDYYRFLSDMYVAFLQAQIEQLRAVVGNRHFITHNLMDFSYGNIDYFDLAKSLDVVSWDNYLLSFWRADRTADPVNIALNHAAMRGLKHQAFWVMEQQAGHSGWQIISPSPKPGEIALPTNPSLMEPMASSSSAGAPVRAARSKIGRASSTMTANRAAAMRKLSSWAVKSAQLGLNWLGPKSAHRLLSYTITILGFHSKSSRITHNLRMKRTFTSIMRHCTISISL